MTNETQSVRYSVENGRLFRYSGSYKPSDSLNSFRDVPSTRSEIITPTSKVEEYLVRELSKEFGKCSERLQRALRVCSNIATTKANQINSLYNIGNGDHVADSACYAKSGSRRNPEYDLFGDIHSAKRSLLRRLIEWTHYNGNEKKYIFGSRTPAELERAFDSSTDITLGKVFDRTLTEQEYKNCLEGKYPCIQDILEREQEIQRVRKVQAFGEAGRKLSLKERFAYLLLK